MSSPMIHGRILVVICAVLFVLAHYHVHFHL